MRVVVRLALLLVLTASLLAAPARAEQSHPAALAWSRDGSLVAACGIRNATVFDASNGTVACRVSLTAMPTGVALSPDGKILAVSTLGSRLALYDVPSGRLLRAVAGDKRFGGGFDITFTADGRWIVTTGISIGYPAPDPFVRVWDVPTGALVSVLPGPRGDVSPKGTWMVSRNPVEERVIVQAVPSGQRRVYNSARLPFAPFGDDDKRICIVNDASRNVEYIDLPDGQTMPVLPVPEKGERFGLSDDLLYLVTNATDASTNISTVTVTRLKDRWKTAELQGRNVSALMFSKRGMLAVEERTAGQVRLLVAQTGATAGICKGGAYPGVHEYMQYGFSADGRAFAIVDTGLEGKGVGLRLFDGLDAKVRWTQPVDLHDDTSNSEGPRLTR